MESQMQQAIITPLIQKLYNLTFNPAFRGGAAAPEHIRIDEGIVLFPNGLDIILPNGQVKAIKWELHDEHRVTNVSFVPLVYFNRAHEALEKYLKHTE
ncbi:hypothetical protein AVT69_gp371 [Pseudomonas phage PhiPA3]|uniref:Uncharacterized protein 365 n=1 Tax=Pseudomonas phage PhiPA3 TaxID=998086 RepID=F8SJJ7_BPPA3|nr:hypothetical protein AVT69_gp371 [Pseudomonas phage PhiPA3]AEH03788.1 hypothetical protein [Pseudomonas phage PhiPA3]